MGWLSDPEAWIALATLSALEIVLGIDNIIFISILSGRLPADQQARARRIGLLVAMLSRIALLFSLTWIMGLTAPLFTALGREISGRDVILIVGGLFLLGKSTHEIHERIEGAGEAAPATRAASLGAVLVQVMLLDLVFSLDSVITAVGMADDVSIMITAVVLSVAIMMVFANWVSAFVHRHPTVKMLALSFLLMIGVALVADGLGQHISKGYIYFAMAFSLMVELLNQRAGPRARTTAAS
jgi:predicted tellurium resistance membrane protein TerC